MATTKKPAFPEDPDIFGTKAKAEECRELAVLTNDANKRQELLALANEYDEISAALMRLQTNKLGVGSVNSALKVGEDKPPKARR